MDKVASLPDGRIARCVYVNKNCLGKGVITSPVASPRSTAHESLEMMGLSDHETVIVAHQDQAQKHVHVIVNRVHLITGLAKDCYFIYNKDNYYRLR